MSSNQKKFLYLNVIKKIYKPVGENTGDSETRKQQKFYWTFCERLIRQPQGSPRGRSKNKFTILKNAFIDAFEELGGVDNLVKRAKANQTEFYRIRNM